ncbi:MAG TPA: GDSL-type esterase/lipase family protein [Steroidobacteraceae bacterium]|jgi:lysophospholipase L1-like esterase
MKRRTLLLGLGGALSAGLRSQTGAADASADAALAEQLLHTDWPYLARYRDDDQAIVTGRTPLDAVFLGDSITLGWLSKDPAFFVSGRVCRGIGGQTTPQMLLRFRQDVIDLQPRVVHIMAGTNDIAGNTGPSTQKMMQDNFLGMAEIATANRVQVIFASVLPASDFYWRPGLDTVAAIAALNVWLKSQARRLHAGYADYYTAMSDGAGAMRPGLSYDRVHPTAEGYAVMRPVAEAALAQTAHASAATACK